MKTKYQSFLINKLPKGCKYCVKGEKLVLFISGKCSRACWYCSLSKKRKNKDIVWSNERKTGSVKDFINEVKESNATSMGITGGDPLLFVNKAVKYSRILKQKFGKSFHIHVYLPTKLVTRDKLKKISEYIDEVRFHPDFISNPFSNIDEEMRKIKIASLFWDKKDIGIELPMIPEKKQEILNFILRVKNNIGFVNLNEFELSETNMSRVTRKYELNEGGYVIKKSKNAGIWLLNQLKNRKIRINVHFCTAKLKNEHQFRNRLLRHNILPCGKRTKEGLVKYLVTYIKPKTGNFFHDKKKKRYILTNELANKLIKKQKIYLIEEFPTSDGIETEKQEIRL